MMITSINVPKELIERVKKYNAVHIELPISVSGICRKAIENRMNDLETI